MNLIDFWTRKGGGVALDLALLIIAAKAFLEKDPCRSMTPGSPAWLACKERNR